MKITYSRVFPIILVSMFSFSHFLSAFAQEPNSEKIDIRFVDPNFFRTDANSAYAGDSIGVAVYDPDVKFSPDTIDTILIDIVNKTTKQKTKLTLTETDRESNEFRGVFKIYKSINGESGPNGIPARNRDIVSGSFQGFSADLKIFGQSQLVVGPTRIYFHIAQGASVDNPLPKDRVIISPGDSLTRKLTLVNIGEEEGYFNISSLDYYKDASDNLMFFDAREASTDENLKKVSMSSWINVRGPKRVLLKPNESRDIVIDLHVPKDAIIGGHYASLIFTEERDPNAKTGSPIVATKEYALPLLIANIGDSKTLSLSGKILSISAGVKDVDFIDSSFFRIPLFGSGSKLPITVRMGFLNTGNASFKPQGAYLVKNIFGSVVATNPIENSSSSFPYIKRTYEQNLVSEKIFWLGKYEITFDGKDGANSTLNKESVSVVIISDSSIIALIGGLFVCIFIALFISRRKRNRDTK